MEKALREAGNDEPRAVAECLLSHFLGCGRMDLALRSEISLTRQQSMGLEAAMERLIAGEPLQYVLGEVDFLGRIFKTDRRALIPRPETELLVEEVLADSGLWSRPGVSIADVGTGTGCMAVCLALLHVEAEIAAVDISPEALDLARENARSHGVDQRIRFLQGDLLQGWRACSLDAVVSNPPYVSTGEWARLPVMIRQYEPRDALDGGEDGLLLVRRLVEQAAGALKPGGRIFLEMGEDQAARVDALLVSHGFENLKIRRDLCGHERIATGAKR
ncbi:MAG: peptide chain release factor N(5)-glutamine methyltransferase [Lentisphaerota bacterium]